MRRILYTALLSCCLYSQASALSYKDSINIHRKEYKEEFITDPESPVKGKDTAYLRFYSINSEYCIDAFIKISKSQKPFMLPTHSGKLKKYVEYATATFNLNGKTHILHIYQALDLIAKDPKYKDYLFIPFKDLTNYAETFGGGRYLDISAKDIKNGHVRLDFNNCYNMLCAYSEGFSCPIPPSENSLKVAIKAGEKLYAKP
jgi:uncharacterized protein